MVTKHWFTYILITVKKEKIYIEKTVCYPTKLTTDVWEMALSIWRSINNNGSHNKGGIFISLILLVMNYFYSINTLFIKNYILLSFDVKDK